MTSRPRRYILRAVTGPSHSGLPSPDGRVDTSTPPRHDFPAFETQAEPIRARLALAIRAAREAGAILLGHLGRLEAVEHKSAIDLVTKAEIRSKPKAKATPLKEWDA